MSALKKPVLRAASRREEGDVMLDKLMIVVAAMCVTVAVLSMALVVKKITDKPIECLAAPDVVRGWHSISAHPEERMVCGWHQSTASVPSLRCIRMIEVCP